jgi:hypothetical protein
VSNSFSAGAVGQRGPCKAGRHLHNGPYFHKPPLLSGCLHIPTGHITIGTRGYVCLWKSHARTDTSSGNLFSRVSLCHFCPQKMRSEMQCRLAGERREQCGCTAAGLPACVQAGAWSIETAVHLLSAFVSECHTVHLDANAWRRDCICTTATPGSTKMGDEQSFHSCDNEDGIALY